MTLAVPALPSPAADAPSWPLLGLEPLRAALEYARLRLGSHGTSSKHPVGDGHSVVIFPGLASDRRATAPLSRFCSELGYATLDWGRGFNTGPRGDPIRWMDELATHVDALTASGSGRISLVGWSLGGIYAREVAKRLPKRTRQVITIGTPFAGTPEQTNVSFLYRLLNGNRPVLDAELQRQLVLAPEAPTTSIYSRSDGIVAWQACVQRGGHARTENIEVAGSHCGLGWNPAVLSVVADRLAQPAGRWRPHAAGRR